MASSDCVALFVCSMLVMFAGVVKVDGAGCKDAKLCCQGKDNVCVVEGSRVNGQNNDTCFCDSACSILQDCCLDYSKYCKRELNLIKLLGWWNFLFSTKSTIKKTEGFVRIGLYSKLKRSVVPLLLDCTSCSCWIQMPMQNESIDELFIKRSYYRNYTNFL